MADSNSQGNQGFDVSQQDLYGILNNLHGTTLQPQDVLNHIVSQGLDIEGYPIANASVQAQNSYRWNKMQQQTKAPVEGLAEPDALPGATGIMGTALNLAGAAVGKEKEINAASAGTGAVGLGELGVGLGQGLVGGARALPGAIKGSVLSRVFNGVTSAAVPAEQATQEAGQLLSSRALKVEDMVGGFRSDQQNGAIIQNAISAASQKARAVAGEAFESLKTNAPNSATVPYNLQHEAYGQALDLSQLPKQFQTGKLASYIKSLSGNLGQDAENTMSLKDMMAARGELSQLAASQSGISGLAGQTSNTGRVAYNLIGALDKDIQANAALNAPDFAKDYAAARGGWKTFKDTFSSPEIEKVMSANPSDVAQIAFRNPETIAAVQNAGGDAAVDAIKNSTTQQIMTKLGSVNKPQSILEKAIALKPDEFQSVFSPDELSILRDYTGARQHMVGLPLQGVQSGSNPVGAAFDFMHSQIPGPYKAALTAAGSAAGWFGGKKVVKKVIGE